MTLRKWIAPVLAAVAALALALAWWLRDMPWPAMLADVFVAAPPSAPDAAGAQDEAQAEAQVAAQDEARAKAQAAAQAEARAEALAERRRQAEQAAAELERRLASAEQRAAQLQKTLAWGGLEERLSAARRLLEIAHAPDKALELLQRTLREIGAAPGMEAARAALTGDIARLTEYTAQSPRRAAPLIGELLAMLEPVGGAGTGTGRKPAPVNGMDGDTNTVPEPINGTNTGTTARPEPAPADGANTGANTGANNDTDAAPNSWNRFLARLAGQFKAAVRVERRAAPSADNTRLLRHLLMRARLAALENDAQAFDALVGDAAQLAADRNTDSGDAALRDGLARLRALKIQWRPPSIGAALGPPPAPAQ